jgi:hypothetical protein
MLVYRDRKATMDFQAAMKEVMETCSPEELRLPSSKV